MNSQQKKQYAVRQDDDDRKNYDKKWEKINTKLRQQDGGYKEPNRKINNKYLISL